MKKLLFILGLAAIAASCSVNRAAVSTTYVQTPIVSTTVVSLDVSPNPVSYTYEPSRQEKKLPISQLVSNAIYEALQRNGNADELVKVSYYVNGKRGFFGFIKVKSITVTGYPVTYKNFREIEPNDKNIEAIYGGTNISLGVTNTNRNTNQNTNQNAW